MKECTNKVWLTQHIAVATLLYMYMLRALKVHPLRIPALLTWMPLHQHHVVQTTAIPQQSIYSSSNSFYLTVHHPQIGRESPCSHSQYSWVMHGHRGTSCWDTHPMRTTRNTTAHTIRNHRKWRRKHFHKQHTELQSSNFLKSQRR